MKRCFSFVLILILVFAAAGCNKKPEEPPSASPVPTAAPTASAEAPTETPAAEPTELPILSLMTEEECAEKLRELGADVPEDLSFDIRNMVAGFETDINMPYPGDVYFDDMFSLFEQIRAAVKAYYGEDSLPLWTAAPTEAPTPAPTAMPERPDENTNIPRVIAGEDVFFIVKPDGSLYGWGKNDYGQLGIGTTEDVSAPRFIANGLTPVIVGETVFALSEDNILWGWGRNNCGQLGTGDLENRLRPVELMHFVKTAVKGRDSFYALTENGEVYKWGVDPMLNNIIDIDHSTIWEPELLFDNVTYFDGDYAIKQNGELWQRWDGDWRLIANEVRRVWHDRDTIAMEGTDGRLYTLGNREGIISEPDEGRRLVAENFRSVVVSEGTIWVLTDDGSLYSYMAAYSNLLSHVSETDFDKLTFVMNEVVEFAADSYMDEDWGFDYKFALKANGELWAWGVYPEPSLGKTQMSDPNEPECVARGVRSITSTGAQTYIICEDGSLWASGIGPEAIPVFGSLGDGTTATRYGFVSLEAEGFCTVTSVMRTEYVSFDDETDSVALYCRTFAVDAEGTVFAWGWNGDRLLGTGSSEETVLSPELITINE